MANTAAKKITYDGKPVQVESAIRDGTGKIINQTYLEKHKVINFTIPDGINPGTSVVIAEYSGTYSNTPGQVIFTIEISDTSGPDYGIYTFLVSWSSETDRSCITLLSSSGSGMELFNEMYLLGYSTGPVIAISPNYDWTASGRVTVYESTDELEWQTEWNTEIDYNYDWSTTIGFTHPAYIDYALNSGYTDLARNATRDHQDSIIDVAYVKHAEYTVAVSTSQQYHKSFSDLALGTNSSGQARKPRQVEIYDLSGNQIQTDVTIDLTNSRITIYPTAVSPAQTWTVRVTAW